MSEIHFKTTMRNHKFKDTLCDDFIAYASCGLLSTHEENVFVLFSANELSKSMSRMETETARSILRYMYSTSRLTTSPESLAREISFLCGQREYDFSVHRNIEIDVEKKGSKYVITINSQ